MKADESLANPLALHAAISMCRRLGVRGFEVGRFLAHESEKQQRITSYKSQFSGSVVRMPNALLRPDNVDDRLHKQAIEMARKLSATFPTAAKIAHRVRVAIK